MRQSFNGISGFGKELAAALAKLDALIDKIDTVLTCTCGKCPSQSKTLELPQTINGIGPIGSISLANLLQRASGDAIIAFFGYDANALGSGQQSVRRPLSKRGPAELRRLLFLAAMAAGKTILWKPIHQHDRARGLSTIATLCIIARKILRIALSIYKHQMPFDPKRLDCPA